MLLILACVAVVMYIPAGILISEGFQPERISIGQGTASIKAVHISDLHYPDASVSIDRLKKEIERFSPDLIFLTGDLYDSTAVKEDIDALSGFLSFLGNYCNCYMVLGNHEILLKDLVVLKTLLRDCRITLLENAACEIVIHEKRIGIAGISDKCSYGVTYVEGLDALTEDIPVLLLAHRPEKWEEYLGATTDRIPLVTFSGHAHGGQVKLFGIGLYSPASGWFPKYYDGLYKKQGHYLVVSRGLGGTEFPYRVYNRFHMPCVTINL